MCGIAGFWNVKTNDTQLLKLLHHRGPDEKGILEAGKARLYAARLSIVDLKNGKQPMTSANSKTSIVMNGEIYNYKKLKEKLSSFQFQTNTDTEVALHLFEKKGIGCFKEFEGMFAMAILSGEKFIIARDKFGIKPLYYAADNKTFRFASEKKAILASGCDWEKIQELPPGSYLTYNKGNASLKKYYSPKPMLEKYKNEKSTVKKLGELVESATEKTLTGDEKIGVLLSGGLDSSILASILAKKGKTMAFTTGLKESKDMQFAELLSEKKGIKLFKSEFSPEKMLKIIPKIIWHLEGTIPQAVRNSIPNFFAAEKAKEKVKVVLCGEGSDELFGGYSIFKEAKNPIEAMEKSFNELHTLNLSRVDRMTMANSVEARVPFLDEELVDFAKGISLNLKIKGNIEKYVLRQSFRGELPKEIANRPKVEFQRGTGVRDLLKNSVESNGKTEAEFYNSILQELLKNFDNIGKNELKKMGKVIWDEYGN